MNAAQHASNILEAWQLHDRQSLGAALELASLCRMPSSLSEFESERTEVLQSVVEHLRLFSAANSFPEISQRHGAAALLLHLSRGAQLARRNNLRFFPN